MMKNHLRETMWPSRHTPRVETQLTVKLTVHGMLLPPSPGTASISGNVKVHKEDVEGFVGTTVMQLNTETPAKTPPLGGSVREVLAVEDEVESVVGIITASLTIRTSILRLKDLMATLIGKKSKMKRGCSGHPCNLDAGSPNHLERVKEGRDLEDDGMQTTMKSQRIRQLDTNRAQTTPD